MDRNLALEFVRVTEAAAIAASDWIGRGDKISADQAAVSEMRLRFNQIDFRGEIVIGEGEKDKAPMLFTHELVGKSKTPCIDLAVDPLEATDSVAYGRYNAISVIAAGPQGTILSAPDTYMSKIAVGQRAKKVIDLDAPVKINITRVAKALEKTVDEVTIVVLDRTRHSSLIQEIRDAGARVQLITDGDVSGAIVPSLHDSGIDMLLGIGASTEAVLAASAIKTLGGELLCRFQPRNNKDKQALESYHIDVKKIFSVDELIREDTSTFTATGVIDGPLLKGVIRKDNMFITHSLVIRGKSKTIRYLTTYHHGAGK